MIADRSFGNRRWLAEVQERGWGFVQRLARDHYLEVEERIGTHSEPGIHQTVDSRGAMNHDCAIIREEIPR